MMFINFSCDPIIQSNPISDLTVLSKFMSIKIVFSFFCWLWDMMTSCSLRRGWERAGCQKLKAPLKFPECHFSSLAGREGDVPYSWASDLSTLSLHSCYCNDLLVTERWAAWWCWRWRLCMVKHMTALPSDFVLQFQLCRPRLELKHTGYTDHILLSKFITTVIWQSFQT